MIKIAASFERASHNRVEVEVIDTKARESRHFLHGCEQTILMSNTAYAKSAVNLVFYLLVLRSFQVQRALEPLQTPLTKIATKTEGDLMQEVRNCILVRIPVRNLKEIVLLKPISTETR